MRFAVITKIKGSVCVWLWNIKKPHLSGHLQGLYSSVFILLGWNFKGEWAQAKPRKCFSQWKTCWHWQFSGVMSAERGPCIVALSRLSHCNFRSLTSCEVFTPVYSPWSENMNNKTRRTTEKEKRIILSFYLHLQKTNISEKLNGNGYVY